MSSIRFRVSVALGALGLSSLPAFAADAKIDSADTGFMIFATALVLMMTMPGLALFYAGMVRKKNVLATMAQSLAATAIVSLLWLVAGYSLTFRGTGQLIGDFSATLLLGIGPETISGFAKTIPELLFCAYQMTFAVITCALVGGATVARLKFSAFALFCILWLFIVYIPSAHWVWGGGFLGDWGFVDFAGGTVVHINAGVAGLVAALMIGPRAAMGGKTSPPSICPWPLLASACCGSAGSASTAARRSASARAPSTPSPRPISRPARELWCGLASNGSIAGAPRCSG